MEAPLSSPSLNGPSQTHASYFMSGSSNSSSAASSSAQSSAPNSAAQAQTQQHQQYHNQTQQYQPAQPTQQSQIPQQSQMQSADGTSPFLRDFNLVAEAAKRAQMAVLMRDMEAVGL
jgi:hypothetical protein